MNLQNCSMNSDDFDSRYGPGWQRLSAQSFRLQAGRCAGCGKTFEKHEGQLHHFHYMDESGNPLRDEMLLGKDGVWLCGAKQDAGTCHWQVHQKAFWRVDPQDPVNGNHNTPEVIVQLQRNWRSLTGIDPRCDRPALEQAIALKLPQPVGSDRRNSVVQAVPTTPESIGTAAVPDQWYEHDGKLINARVAGDLAPGYDPSDKFRARLAEIDDLAAQARFRQPAQPLKGFSKGLNDLVLPLLFLAALFLTIWIAS
jgi:hypothetical protein